MDNVAMPVEAGRIIEQAASGGGSADIKALEQDFNRLMDAQPPSAGVSDSHAAQGPSAIGEFFKAHEHAMQSTIDGVKKFAADSPGMSMQELTGRQMEMTMQMACVQSQFTATVSVGQSGKNALQTLMKNQ